MPSAGIPTVDIGIRQKGRAAASSAIHCGDTSGEIAAAIRLALSEEGRRAAAVAANPYYQPDTLRKVVDAIALTPLEKLRRKHFNDIEF